MTAVELGKKIKAGEITAVEAAVEGSPGADQEKVESDLHSLCHRD
ncbi:MAG: hypothetical protein ACLSG9_11640 [Eubacterium sp.]